MKIFAMALVAAIFASAVQAQNTGSEPVRKALIRTMQFNLEKEADLRQMEGLKAGNAFQPKTPRGVPSWARRATTQALVSNSFKRRAAASPGTPIPELPMMFGYPVNITEEGNLVVNLDGLATFESPEPITFLVNGTPADTSVKAQSYGPGEPGASAKLYGNAVSEFHYVNVEVPGKLGPYTIEARWVWKDGLFFPVIFSDELRPEGTIFYICALQGATDAEDKAAWHFAFLVWDGKFPSSLKVSVNDIPLEPVEPFMVSADPGPFKDFRLVSSRKNYEEIAASAAETGEIHVVVSGVEGELVIEWYDYPVPSFGQLEDCMTTPTSGPVGSSY